MHACPKCAREISGRPNFCPACGASLTHEGGSADDPLIGRIIGGSYKIEALIGEGAMGRVYQAHQIQLRKKVALKILRSNLVSDVTVVKRFEREALAASRLNNPNCISIFGFGQEDDGELLWMAMEFILGRDLGEIIAEDSPLATQRIIHILSQVCEALDEAHSANIIHRDLKPANIVCFDHRRTKDFVKVLDFGIAKIVDPEPGDDYQALTRDGIVCGTPAYMSPEQVQGFPLDNRSDLFSLGIILYQTLTGQLPFFAESAVEVATKIVIDEPVPPSKARPDWSYPAELETVVLKLLAKKKEERYSNAMDVRDDLKEVLATLESRRDASLDLNAAELHDIMSDTDSPIDGAATLQLSADMIARAMAAEALGPRAVPASTNQLVDQTAPSGGPDLATEPIGIALMTSPSSARRDGTGGGKGVIGIGLIVAAAIGAAAWWFFTQR